MLDCTLGIPAVAAD